MSVQRLGGWSACMQSNDTAPTGPHCRAQVTFGSRTAHRFGEPADLPPGAVAGAGLAVAVK
ncbi:MAG: hypothetical protein NTV94_17730 [Planctomycetota bacterium]|nr:hypothetical protein [Planctomycetota bacterium]